MKEAIVQVDNLIYALRNVDINVRKNAVRQIEKYKVKEAAPMVLQLLTSQDKELRFLAVKALGTIGNSDMVDKILPLLSDEDDNVKYWASATISQLGNEETVQKIKEILPAQKDPYWAIRALSKMGALSVNLLVEFLKSNNWNLRSLASSALVKIGNICISKIIPILKIGNIDTRYWAIKTLGEIGSATVVENLRPFLEDISSDIRVITVKALYNIGNQAAIDILKQAALDSQYDDVRFTATECLSNLKEFMKEFLLAKFKDSSFRVRDVAARGFVKSGKPEEILAQLEKLRNSGDENERFTAVRAMGYLGVPAIINLCQALSDKSWAVRRLASNFLSNIGRPSIPFLERVLLNEKKGIEEKYWALQAISKIATKDCLPVLLEFAKHENRDLRYAAISGLARFSEPDVINTLIESLNDASQEVREATTRALSKLGKTAIPLIISKFKDKDWNIRKLASEAMVAMGKVGLPFLLKGFKSKDSDISYWSAKSLAGIGRLAVNYLIAMFTDNSWIVRKRASEIIIEIGKEALPLLMKVLFESGHPDMRYWIIKTIGEIRDESACDRLIEIVSKGSEQERIQAIIALSKIGGKKAEKCVLESLFDEYWSVRKAAAKASGVLRIQEAEQPLFTLLKDEDDELRAEVILALGEIAGEEKLESLAKFLKDASFRVRLAAVKSIAKASGTVAIKLLRPMLSDASLDVREATIKALGTLGFSAVQDLLIPFLKVPDLRQAALESLVNIGGDKAAKEALAILENVNENVSMRVLAARYLGKSENSQYIDTLVKFMDDDCWHIRLEVSAALSKISESSEPDYQDVIVTKVFKKKGGDALQHFKRGVMFSSKGRYNEAIAEFKKAIKIEPRYVRSYLNIGLIYKEQNILDQAEKYFRQALSVDPEDARAHLYLGVTLALTKNLKEAERHLKQALKSRGPDAIKITAQKVLKKLKKG